MNNPNIAAAIGAAEEMVPGMPQHLYKGDHTLGGPAETMDPRGFAQLEEEPAVTDPNAAPATKPDAKEAANESAQTAAEEKPKEGAAEEKPASEEGKPTPTTPQEQPQVKPIELFGRQFEEAQLKEIIDKGEHFTQEMQRFRQVERDQTALLDNGRVFNDAMAMFRGNPEEARKLISGLEEQAMQIHGEKFRGPAPQLPEMPKVDESKLSDEALEVFNYAKAMEGVATEALKRVGDTDKRLASIENRLETSRASTELETAAETIRKEYKATVSPAQLRTMMESTGVNDPIKAFKVANFDRAPATSTPAKPPEAARKPNVPTSEGLTLDISKLNVDQIARALSSGAITREQVEAANTKKR